jgi:c-di-GMP-binding flagellar brake protein YcgR
MFHDTRPAELDAGSGIDPWAEFRVTHPQERLRLLRTLREGSSPVILNTPGGQTLTVTLWVVDSTQERLNFNIDPGLPQLAGVVDADEVVAVAYLDSVKLQFDLHGLLLVHGANSSALQSAMPREIYRFQRRGGYRVRPRERQQPVAHFRHSALPEMALALRVLDVSIGGCALWLPQDVPPLQAGTLLGEVVIELDADTRFAAAVRLQHVSAQGSNDGRPGARLGCEWQALAQGAERTLQRWIDRTQQRHRLLNLG